MGDTPETVMTTGAHAVLKNGKHLVNNRMEEDNSGTQKCGSN